MSLELGVTPDKKHSSSRAPTQAPNLGWAPKFPTQTAFLWALGQAPKRQFRLVLPRVHVISSPLAPSRPLAHHFSPSAAARVCSPPPIRRSTFLCGCPATPRKVRPMTPANRLARRDPWCHARPAIPTAWCDLWLGDSPIEGKTETAPSWSFRARVE